MANALKIGAWDTRTHQWADEAAREVAERRAKAGGQRSGDTVIILAQAMNRVTEAVRSRTNSKWVKVVAGVGGSALLVIGLLAGVVFYQQQQIDRLVHAKTTIDYVSGVGAAARDEAVPPKPGDAAHYSLRNEHALRSLALPGTSPPARRRSSAGSRKCLDVLLVDLGLPDGCVIEVIDSCRRLHPHCDVMRSRCRR